MRLWQASSKRVETLPVSELQPAGTPKCSLRGGAARERSLILGTYLPNGSQQGREADVDRQVVQKA